MIAEAGGRTSYPVLMDMPIFSFLRYRRAQMAYQDEVREAREAELQAAAAQKKAAKKK